MSTSATMHDFARDAAGLFVLGCRRDMFNGTYRVTVRACVLSQLVRLCDSLCLEPDQVQIKSPASSNVVHLHFPMHVYRTMRDACSAAHPPGEMGV